MQMRRSGFTLIELLVVIAIIGILAAMLFPVFARARESARKIQCLSNVKNIAMAMQMYLTDYDAFPPRESNATVLAYFDDMPGGASSWAGTIDGHCNIGCKQQNPYVRWPVVLEEYIKNRDVWRCPSAKAEIVAEMILPDPNYFAFWQSHQSGWGTNDVAPCHYAWPSGWGGTVTDSWLQGNASSGSGAFAQSIATNSNQSGTKMGAIDRPANYAICADGGVKGDAMSLELTGWPDICALGCANPTCIDLGVAWVDWENCASDAGDCIYRYADAAGGEFKSDPQVRKQYTRHMGGVNIGYLDGHAGWIASEALIQRVKNDDVDGLGTWGPTSACGGLDYVPLAEMWF